MNIENYILEFARESEILIVSKYFWKIASAHVIM